MSFCVVPSKRFALALALVAAMASLAPNVHAQAPPAQSAEDQELEKLLTGAELFFKKSYSDQGQRWEYAVAWNQDGETTYINIYVKELAKRNDGSRICVAYCWTPVVGVPQGQELPADVIKGVAAFNENLNTGNLSATANVVFANSGIVLKDLSSDALWIYLWDLQDTRTQLKKAFGKIMSGG